MTVVSPDITTVLFAIEYDLSGVLPKVRITNQCVGPNLSLCKYTFECYSPNGTPFHLGTFAPPDKTGVWTTFEIPEPMPQVLGHIVWGASPWKVVAKVRDNVNTEFVHPDILDVLCRPNGNTDNQKNNFGSGQVYMEVICRDAKLYVEDTSDYVYQGVAASIDTKTIKLVYPQDDSVNAVEPFEAEDVTNLRIPIYFSGEGYQILLDTIAHYLIGQFTTVKIKYKYRQTFSVLCNIDLCNLQCYLAKFENMIEVEGCTAEERNNLILIMSKLQRVMIGVMQPLCKIDVYAILADIRKLSGVDCGGCVGAGINPLPAVNACQPPKDLTAILNVGGTQVVIDWEPQVNSVDQLVITGDISSTFNSAVPPISVPVVLGDEIEIKVKRTCADGSLSESGGFFSYGGTGSTFRPTEIIRGKAGDAGFPAAGATSWTRSDFANSDLDITLNNIPLDKDDQGDGSYYFTKANSGVDTVNFSGPIVAGDKFKVTICPQ